MSGVGALIQLMSKGKQNEILNANPQITYWRFRHLKYTDFALEHSQVTGATDNLSSSTEQVFDLPRSGDLVNDCFACFHLPGLANVVSATKSATTSLANETYAAYGHNTTDGAESTGKRVEVAPGGAITGKTVFIARHADTTRSFNGGQFLGGDVDSNLNPTTAGNKVTLLDEAAAGVYQGFIPAYPGSHIGASATAVAGSALTSNAADALATALYSLNWTQMGAGPDPFNLETSWDAEARCMRPSCKSTSKVSDQSIALAKAYAARVAGADPAEYVQYCSKGSSGIDVNGTGYTYECIESSDERKRYHLQADRDGGQALTVPGPQPYYCDSVGQALIDYVRLKVGSQFVDTLYSHYLNMWDELSDKPGRTVTSEGTAYGEMMMRGTAAQRKAWSQTARTVYVPIPMFFMRTSGNALPLIALQFHGVQIGIKSHKVEDCIMNYSKNSATITGLNSSLWSDNNGMAANTNNIADTLFGSTLKTVVRQAASTESSGQTHLANQSYTLNTVSNQFTATEVAASDIKLTLNVGYVYLNVSERNKFADASFEILINQTQDNNTGAFTSATPSDTSLSLNHCVQELLWACTRDKGINREPFDFSGCTDTVNGCERDSVKGVQLRLNNSTRFNEKGGQEVPGNYFRTVEPYLHHTRVPNKNVYAYSFALNPESEQPSGAVNMSRVDQAKFKVNLAENMLTAGINSHAREAVRVNAGGSVNSQLQSSTVQMHLFARNWNIFRITLGLGGVKWAS